MPNTYSSRIAANTRLVRSEYARALPSLLTCCVVVVVVIVVSSCGFTRPTVVCSLISGRLFNHTSPPSGTCAEYRKVQTVIV